MKRKIAILSAAIVVAFSGTPGRGADVDPPSEPSKAKALPGVEVTANRGAEGRFVIDTADGAAKTDVPVHETPQSISVIGRDQLDDRNVQTLNDALHYTAGVATYYSNDTRNDAFTLRGFGAEFMYLDGTRLGAVAGRGLDQWRVDPYQLDRIEVVKGPASMLYGLGEPGGVVNMVSKMPTEDARHQVDITAGSYNHYGLGIDTSGPLSDDGRLLYRFIAQESYSENQVDYVHGTRTLLAPSLTWRPDDRTSLTVMATYLHDDTMDSNNFLPRIGTLVPNDLGQKISTRLSTSNPGYENYDKTQASIGYLFERELSEAWRFRQNFRYAYLTLDNQALFGFRLLADQQTILRAAMNLGSSFSNVDLDNQFLGKLESGPVKHTVLLGLNATSQNFADNEGYDYGYPLNLYHPVYGPVQRPDYNDTRTRQLQQQIGLYAQDQMRYDRWVLALSGREDAVRSTTHDYLGDTRQTQTNHAFSGRAGLMYLFDNGLAPYASYSTSFLPVAGTDAYSHPYRPLTSHQVEVGLKYQPAAMNATFSAAAFDLRQNNTLTQVDNPMLNGSVQQGQTRSRGIELEATAELTSQLKLLTAYTLQEVKVTKGSIDDPTVGKAPSATPRHLASVWLDYTLPHGPFAGLGFNAGAQYVGASYGNSANSFQVPSFTVFDAGLHYTLAQWRFVLTANNLTDRIYVARCGIDTRCQYGQRRNAMLTARYSW